MSEKSQVETGFSTVFIMARDGIAEVNGGVGVVDSLRVVESWVSWGGTGRGGGEGEGEGGHSN